MHYSIKHTTRFAYETPISESVMEVRMQPLSDGLQRCLQFSLTTTPPARVMMYQEHDGNTVHHFNIPARHSRLTLTAEAIVETMPHEPLPHRLAGDPWSQLDAQTRSGGYWEYLTPSAFVQETPLLAELRASLDLKRDDDPLTVLRRVMQEIYTTFEYKPRSTRVDSPIDDALAERCGVCQDFAHIFLALLRPVGVPARYVSGYLFRDGLSTDRSPDGATHAWVEAFLPNLGWVGFDPTNNLIAEDRHIRIAIGRDYADVPPTRGVYKGSSAVKSELSVAVRIGTATPLTGDVVPFTPWMSRDAVGPVRDDSDQQQQ